MTAPMENGADPAHPVPPEWLEAKTKGRAALAAEGVEIPEADHA